MVFYTVSHFEAEESLMKKYDYPGYEEHKSIHQKITQQVLSFQKKIQEGDVDLTEELMTFLKDWLIDHILGVDKKYSDYLNEKGVT